MTLGEQFRSVVGGQNFVTPAFISYEEIKDGVAELSAGVFADTELFGVTTVVNGERNIDLDKCFESREEAEEYIKTLKQWKQHKKR